MVKPVSIQEKRADFFGFTFDELSKYLSALGEAPFRATQLFNWVYKKDIRDFTKMSNISKELKHKFNNLLYFNSYQKVEEFESGDGAKKYCFTLVDGFKIETVYIPESARLTLCVSTQVGCPLGCRFCLTGAAGFKKNLTVSEMVSQIMEVRDRIHASGLLTNIVLMGMGEPLLNYENVLKFIKILTDPRGFAFAKRKVTLSTAGILPELERFIREADVSLSISLNAPDDETRSFIMPINKRFPIQDILRVASLYPKIRKRMVTFEYVLIEGINDSPEQAERLTKLLKGVRCKINLIPYNENPFSDFKRPADEAILRFQQILIRHNYTATIRKSRGGDISAACGQLGMHLSTSQTQDRYS